MDNCVWIALFGFVHVVLAKTQSAGSLSLIGSLVLFIVFGIMSVAFWLYFWRFSIKSSTPSP